MRGKKLRQAPPVVAIPPDDFDAEPSWDETTNLMLDLQEISASVERGMRTIRAVVKACETRVDERIVVLSDDETDSVMVSLIHDAVAELGPAADPVTLTVQVREPAFAELPSFAVDTLLAANLVFDLTSTPWLYSDSFTRYAAEAEKRGSRLAIIGGNSDSIQTLITCPPSAGPMARARRGLRSLNEARTLHVRSDRGTNFSVELGDPASYPRSFIGEPPTRPGMIGAPLCASVTAPFVPGTARGTVVYIGGGRLQGPETLGIWVDEPIRIEFADGRVTDIVGESEGTKALAAWFDAAETDDVYVAVDCNLGFDPRGDLSYADNTVVHSYDGGIMFGIGLPYEYRPEGSRKPGFHLDLMLPGADVDLDDRPFIRGGKYTKQSGVK
jgi:hypothetical protein